MRALQLRGEQVASPLPSTAKQLFQLFSRALHKAVHEEVLINGAYDVSRLLRLTPGGRSGGPEVFALTGGPKEFSRAVVARPADHFVRDDGGIVHFSLEVRQSHGSALELIAYGFEVYFPDRQPIPFVRFDLNDRGHSNDDLGLRAHVMMISSSRAPCCPPLRRSSSCCIDVDYAAIPLALDRIICIDVAARRARSREQSRTFSRYYVAARSIEAFGSVRGQPPSACWVLDERTSGSRIQTS
jgi:hypothetical protein